MEDGPQEMQRKRMINRIYGTIPIYEPSSIVRKRATSQISSLPAYSQRTIRSFTHNPTSQPRWTGPLSFVHTLQFKGLSPFRLLRKSRNSQTSHEELILHPMLHRSRSRLRSSGRTATATFRNCHLAQHPDWISSTGATNFEIGVLCRDGQALGLRAGFHGLDKV